jgi:PAS domain S-box-containing protein
MKKLISMAWTNVKWLLRARNMWILFAVWLAVSAVVMAVSNKEMAAARQAHFNYTSQINESGRQRLLSQRIPLMVSLLQVDQSNSQVSRDFILGMLAQMESARELFQTQAANEVYNPYSEKIQSLLYDEEFATRFGDFTKAARNSLNAPNQISSLHIAAGELLPWFERQTKLYELASLAADDHIDSLIDLGYTVRICFLIVLILCVILPAQLIVNKTLAANKRGLVKIASNEKRVRTWLEHSPVCTKVIDLEYNLQYMSSAGIVGLGLEDISQFYGKPYPFDFYPEAFNQSMLASLDNVRKSGSPETLEGRVLDLAGNEMWFHSTIVPVLDDKDQLDYFLVVSADTTERHKTADALESALQQADAANVAKSNFLATMSHEIRTPMNGLMGMLGLLIDTTLDETQDDYSRTALASASQLMLILNDILDLSKAESGKMDFENVPADPEKISNEVMLLFSQAASENFSKLNCVIGADLPRRVLSDPTRIKQILCNLVSNAIKFTSEGEVTLLADYVGDAKKGQLEFRVSDTGIGISADAQKNIFDSFQQADGSTTRQYGGTGLGLSIVAQLVNGLDGSISVDSSEGQGSTFTVSIPVQVSESNANDCSSNASKHNSIANQNLPNENLQILVAEDNATNQKLIGIILKSSGHVPTCVENGQEALRALDTEEFDLVLMDIQMPLLDGIATMKCIRTSGKSYSDIPIIALTANAMVGDKEAYLAAGMNGYVSKPIDPEALFAEIDALSNSHSAAQSSTGNITSLDKENDVLPNLSSFTG